MNVRTENGFAGLNQIYGDCIEAALWNCFFFILSTQVSWPVEHCLCVLRLKLTLLLRGYLGTFLWLLDTKDLFLITKGLYNKALLMRTQNSLQYNFLIHTLLYISYMCSIFSITKHSHTAGTAVRGNLGLIMSPEDTSTCVMGRMRSVDGVGSTSGAAATHQRAIRSYVDMLLNCFLDKKQISTSN